MKRTDNISDKLNQAREYELVTGNSVQESERPVFHFTPRTGWLNDPNGLSFYKGQYHLFYQYHPYNTYWGPMHWGHAVSSDLIRWEYRPAALGPDQKYDQDGCFSGSAVTLEDGRQMLMYTSCLKDGNDPRGLGRYYQSQSLALLDENGEYAKYEGNPVIRREDLTEGTDEYEFRDPFLWKEKDGTYRALVAAGALDPTKGTKLLLFRSEDGLHWESADVFFEDTRRIGIMWECPNFFRLGEKSILIASPMDMIAEANEANGSIRFPQGNNVCYVPGSFLEETEKFVPDHEISGHYLYEPVDEGLDFYAPQTMELPDGRRVMIGWMQNPKTANLEDNGRRELGFFGQMTVPRELSYEGGRLIQWPVKELAAYRREKTEIGSVTISSEWETLPEIRGRILDLDLRICAEKGCPKVGIRIASDGRYYTELSFEPKRSLLTIDRTHAGRGVCGDGEAAGTMVPELNVCKETANETEAAVGSETINQRTVQVKNRGGAIDLKILLDRWSVEVFVNNGEQVLSASLYTDPDAQDILFRADGKAEMDIIQYKLEK